MVFNRMQGSRPGSDSSFRFAQGDNPIMSTILETVAAERAPVRAGDDYVFATDCLYFDASSVAIRVAVSPRGERLTVSDDGNAIDRVIAMERRVPGYERTAKAVAARNGIQANAGVLFANPSCAEEIAVYISIVANASKELADRLKDASIARSYRDLTNEMIGRLDNWFPGIATRRNANILGVSNKVHSFDLEAILENQKTILIDEIRPRNVNTILAASFDVGRRSDIDLSMWAVYDPAIANDIGGPNLTLLASVARTISIDELTPDLLLRRA
ncbi:hypothetical protein NKW43_13250 [Gluconobacter albidus]|uniref:hypothetical protein n=1 Tax=Gluconobacter albidus TaxID=318683 RepID=UPI0020A08377|nr:hypothetical protein [Gluconobacter albidus]MCP1274635.1 hypothetical protein [Gluconobacter albidus]